MRSEKFLFFYYSFYYRGDTFCSKMIHFIVNLRGRKSPGSPYHIRNWLTSGLFDFVELTRLELSNNLDI